MAATVELRDANEAQRFLTEGIWLQRISPTNLATFKLGLEWALEASSAGQPIPPLGFIVDLGQIAFGADQSFRSNHQEVVGFPSGLARNYDDQVIGKFYADYQFERASDALRRYQGRERAKGITFVLGQLRERCKFPGVFLSPASIRGIIEHQRPEELLSSGWDSLTNRGTMPLIVSQYEEMIAACRRSGDFLGNEDVFELEHKTALLEFGQRVALRQLIQASTRLESLLPQHKVEPLRGRQEVPTRVLDEDTYPVGGYSSIATKGTIESLLHSQLAFMEPEKGTEPDLFDIKFVRDELLYYSRDENQFLRKRRTFVFSLFNTLEKAKFKDADLPYQRIVLVMALIVVAIRKLSDWLNADALSFDLVFVGENVDVPVVPVYNSMTTSPTTATSVTTVPEVVYTGSAATGSITMSPPPGWTANINVPSALSHEFNLLSKVLMEQVKNGTVKLVACKDQKEVEEYCTNKARRSLCHCLLLTTADTHAKFHADNTICTQLRMNKAVPEMKVSVALPDDPIEPENSMDGWVQNLERLLKMWV